jgi:hypothetical protein
MHGKSPFISKLCYSWSHVYSEGGSLQFHSTSDLVPRPTSPSERTMACLHFAGLSFSLIPRPEARCSFPWPDLPETYRASVGGSEPYFLYASMK